MEPTGTAGMWDERRREESDERARRPLGGRVHPGFEGVDGRVSGRRVQSNDHRLMKWTKAGGVLGLFALPGAVILLGSGATMGPALEARATERAVAGARARAATERALTGGVWWEAGHAIVCDMAWRELEAPARAAVIRLLALDPDYEEFGPSCYWPDTIGDRPEYDVFRTAHYVNLPRGASGFDLERDCGANLCAVEAIRMLAGRLIDPTLPDEEKLVALKFLGHFVGDIHQPLHAGYAEHRGGNSILACTPGDDSTNLHAVWDGFIVGRLLAADGLDWKAYGARLHADIRPVQRDLWRTLDPAVWATESFALMEDEAYEEVDVATERAIGCFGDEFVLRHRETTERRLKQAGFRLGALLNEIFASGG